MRKCAVKAGAVMFAVSLAGQAVAAGCAKPQDMAALKTAALQQQLMVAAYMCRSADAYNRFVLSNQAELQKADRGVMEFFVRHDAQRGADDYNAFKTKLANSSSLNSQHNSKFCRNARSVFHALASDQVKLTELIATRAPGFEADYMRCAKAKSETTLAAIATPPELPQRRAPLAEAPQAPQAPQAPRHDDADIRSVDDRGGYREDAAEGSWRRDEGYDDATFDERDGYERYRDDRFDEAYDRDFYEPRRRRGFYVN